MPTEGVGVTGKAPFGEPKFRDSHITLDRKSVTQVVTLKYLF